LSKTIKVDDKEYQQLEEIKEKRESFAEVVARLLRLYVAVSETSKLLGPSHYLKNVEQYLANVKAAVDR
jgi:predicted CopG family antitoxin